MNCSFMPRIVADGRALIGMEESADLSNSAPGFFGRIALGVEKPSKMPRVTRRNCTRNLTRPQRVKPWVGQVRIFYMPGATSYRIVRLLIIVVTKLRSSWTPGGK